MKTISTEELKTILENHKHWVKADVEGWEAMCANLSNANLGGANLSYANLGGANLSNVDLRGANLSYANLGGASLPYADLNYANLRNANLGGANLPYANLGGADLRYANLGGADLRNADLSNIDLPYANLRGANLSYANLGGADLRNADLNYANLSHVKNMPYIPMVCPKEGAFIGWKKAEVEGRYVIVKLSVPASAKRSSATSRKCRCNKAKVLEIYNIDGTVAEERKCYSSYNNNFSYEVGKTVKVDNFNENRWSECSQGIHFFMNKQEAIDY